MTNTVSEVVTFNSFIEYACARAVIDVDTIAFDLIELAEHYDVHLDPEAVDWGDWLVNPQDVVITSDGTPMATLETAQEMELELQRVTGKILQIPLTVEIPVPPHGEPAGTGDTEPFRLDKPWVVEGTGFIPTPCGSSVFTFYIDFKIRKAFPDEQDRFVLIDSESFFSNLEQTLNLRGWRTSFEAKMITENEETILMKPSEAAVKAQNMMREDGARRFNYALAYGMAGLSTLDVQRAQAHA